MTVHSFMLIAGSSVAPGIDDPGETLYGAALHDPDLKWVRLPEMHGGARAFIVEWFETRCPMGCDGDHVAARLDVETTDGRPFAVIECPARGFLWCAVNLPELGDGGDL